MTFIFAYFSCSLVVSLAVTAAVVVVVSIVVLFAIFLFFPTPSSFFRAVSFTLSFPLPLADCGGFLGVIAGNNFSDGRRFLSILFSSLSLTSLAFVFFIFLAPFSFSSPSLASTSFVVVFVVSFFSLAPPPLADANTSVFLCNSFCASRARFIANSIELL